MTYFKIQLISVTDVEKCRLDVNGSHKQIFAYV